MSERDSASTESRLLRCTIESARAEEISPAVANLVQINRCARSSPTGESFASLQLDCKAGNEEAAARIFPGTS